MRLFFGLPFDFKTQTALLQVQRELAEYATEGKFPPAENFHLTLVFLGEVKAVRLGELRDILRENPIPPLDLLFARVGQFRGGTWYLDPQPNAVLLSGQAALETALRGAGFPLEARPYHPHLTLGRKVVILPPGRAPTGLLKVPTLAHSSGAVLFHSHQVDGRLQYTPVSGHTHPC